MKPLIVKHEFIGAENSLRIYQISYFSELVMLCSFFHVPKDGACRGLNQTHFLHLCRVSNEIASNYKSYVAYVLLPSVDLRNVDHIAWPASTKQKFMSDSYTSFQPLCL